MPISKTSHRRYKVSNLKLKPIFSSQFLAAENVYTFIEAIGYKTPKAEVPLSASVSSKVGLRANHRCHAFNQKAWLVVEAVMAYKSIAKQTELEDLLQEGFLYLWESLETGISVDADPDRLLREIKNHLRTRRKEQNNLYRLSKQIRKYTPPTAQLPDKTDVELELIQLCINRAFEKLTSKQKEVLTLCFGLNGQPMKVQEIATLKNVTPRAVRKSRQLGCAVLFEDPELHSLAS